jgi:hypothetical protein
VETSGMELLENRVHNKPNGCSATGALAPGPDHQQQHEYKSNVNLIISQ